MHGNTHATSQRNQDAPLRRHLLRSGAVLRYPRVDGAQVGGVHIELTGENVTECIGGARGPREEDLARAYESEVDPRLNYEQSMELAFLIARKMKNGTN